MNKHHQEILEQIKKHQNKALQNKWGASYLGSSDFHYGISNPIKRQIIKNWLQDHKNLSIEEFINLLNGLYSGDSYEEKCMAGMFLGYLPKLRKQIDLKLLDSWLDQLNGWAEVDSTCQSNFTQKELLESWDEWKQFLVNLSKDKNINKRRASLVLLTGPVSHTEDKKLLDISLQNTDRLKIEKDILITKAISWLLRSLVQYHKQAVSEYIDKNMSTLPPIAIRETKRKILTGKK